VALQTPIRNMTLAAQVTRQVEGLITSGEWPVGMYVR
jgi:hypothetical protein